MLAVVWVVPVLKVMVPVPVFFGVMVHVPSPLSVAVARPVSVMVAVMSPVAPFGRAVTLIFRTSPVLPVRVDGVAVRVVMVVFEGLMLPVVSS